MTNDRRCVTGAIAILLMVPWLGAAAAEPEHLFATVDNPAIVTVTPAAGTEARTGQSPQVVIKVTGFQPSEDGPVQAVVKAEQRGKEQEIGRFGIFPHRAFSAAEMPNGQSFGIPLPKALAGNGPLKLSVHLVPTNGEGKGARMEIGGAEIR